MLGRTADFLVAKNERALSSLPSTKIEIMLHFAGYASIIKTAGFPPRPSQTPPTPPGHSP
jgi:hypothetical protein